MEAALNLIRDLCCHEDINQTILSKNNSELYVYEHIKENLLTLVTENPTK